MAASIQTPLGPAAYNTVFNIGCPQTATIKVIEQFQDWKLLASLMVCEYCSNHMRWMSSTSNTSTNRRHKFVDGYFWKCFEITCPRIYCRTSIRSGSFFERSRLTLKCWLHIFFHFSMETSISKTANVLGLRKWTICTAFTTLREYVSNYITDSTITLGGIGKHIEIDEYFLGTHICVFAQVDASVTPKVGSMQVVERRHIDVILPIIHATCLPGSLILSDAWPGYRKISQELGFEHQIVNPVCGANTDAMQSYWAKHKAIFKKIKFLPQQDHQMHLNEAMFRERTLGKFFEALLDVIASEHTL